MKLNLVPATVKKGAAMKTMVALSVLMVLLATLATAFMAYTSSQNLAKAKQEAEDARPSAVEAVATAKYAQAILDNAKGVTTNLMLANDMTAHNTKYTRFYSKVMPYVPSFYRLTSMSVEPIDDKSCRLNLSGVIRTAQQYADLSLALLRIPGARLISRAGFASVNDNVPALTPEDQVGRIVRAGETPLPTDPVERMEAVVAAATEQTTGFENIGNFGSATESARGAMNRWSQVAVSVLLENPAGAQLPEGWNFDFLAPNPTDTLNAAAQFNAAGAAPTGGAAGGGGVIPPPPGGGAVRDGRVSE